MFYKAKKKENGTLGVPIIYGNALRSTMKESQKPQKDEVHINLFIMKHVAIKKTHGREKNILNQEWENVILKTGLSVSYL